MDKLCISFSGGETSGYMLWWLLNHRSSDYEIKVVFANTGEENEATLEFVQRCGEAFGVEIIWVEALSYHGLRKSSGHKVVDFKTASRHGEPFEDMIKKYGIPNMSTPHCSRELKANAIMSYLRSIGWGDCWMAIGIRIDEFDRVNPKYEEMKLVYPLVRMDMQPMTKPKVNFWWSQQSFRLVLKGYEGNCKTCWKKGDKKLYQIAKENPGAYGFTLRMEEKYGMFVPATRLALMAKRGEVPSLPTTFYRGNRSSLDILRESESFNGNVVDDSLAIPQPDLFSDLDESCEVFTECR